MQLKPGQRVYSPIDCCFGTVLGEHPVEKGWYRIRLDCPDVDGHTVSVVPVEELVPVEDKHSA